MKVFEHTFVQAGALALVLAIAALLVSLLLWPLLGNNFFTPFLVVVCVCSWYYGRTGGAFAAAAALAALVLLQPAGAPLTSLDAHLLGRLIAFTVAAVMMTWVTAAWRQSRSLLEAMLSSIGEAVVATDREGRVTFLNSAAEMLLGCSRQAARGKPASAVIQLVHERSREAIENPLVRALRDRVTVTSTESDLLLAPGGAEIPVDHSAAPVRDRAGAVRGGILVFRDTSSRRRLEEQLTHAQKMDAVGRVADGVAGDFNNLLTVITGYSTMLRERLPDEGLRRTLDEITRAAERAAALTRRLRTFSRGADAEPRIIDLNSVIHNMEPLLRRLIGERIDLILLPGYRLAKVKADPAQIEQVIVNLVTNAQEAMPEGGKLVIETANVDIEPSAEGKSTGVAPGSYVMMAVSDTGVGMDAQTRSHVFEPFFTTKAAGTGSGLGLSTVYGAVKQSDGYVTVYSQLGCGSIFEVYLPRATETAAAVHAVSNKGSETILVVDDEEGVRRLVCSVLRDSGYDVLEARHPTVALSLYEKNAHKIDLVLTDVVMPQLNGIELGRRLADRTGALKILYMSGYRSDQPGKGVEEMPRAFLQKPFTPDALLARVREVLDA